MITIRQHRAIGPFAVRVELTTNLSASWAAGRVRLDRNHTHVLRGLDPVDCAARKAHTGRRAARWLWPHSRNTLSIRFWGPESSVRDIWVSSVLALTADRPRARAASSLTSPLLFSPDHNRFDRCPTLPPFARY